MSAGRRCGRPWSTRQGRHPAAPIVPTPADADVPATFTDLIAGDGGRGRARCALPRRGRTPRRRRLRGRPPAVGAEPAPAMARSSCPRRGLSARLGLPVQHRQRRRSGCRRRGLVRRRCGEPCGGLPDGLHRHRSRGGPRRPRRCAGTRSLAEIGHAVVDWRAWRDGDPCTVEDLGSGGGRRPPGACGRARPLGRPCRRSRCGSRRTGGGRDLGAGHRRLCRRCVEPGHVLLPEHRRHRRRHGTPGSVFYATARHGVATPWSSSRRSGDRPLRPRGRRRSFRRRRLGRRHRRLG